MSNIPPSVPTIGKNETKFLCVYEPIFHFQRNTSMQHAIFAVEHTKHAA